MQIEQLHMVQLNFILQQFFPVQLPHPQTPLIKYTNIVKPS